MFLFFGLNHPNYSRWGSVHIRDMKSLNTEAASVLSKSWVVQKTNHKFSTTLLDHAHEQENAKLKIKGGSIALTEDPQALKKWYVSAPEKPRVMTEFENVLKHDTDLELDYLHHDESMSMQSAFQKEFSSLTGKIREYENPFFEISDKLMVLDSRICVAESCVKMMRDIERIGKRQYASFKRDIFQNDKDIQSPIKRIKFVFFSSMQPRRNQQLQKSLKG